MHGYFRLLLGTALGWRPIGHVTRLQNNRYGSCCPRVLCLCSELVLCGSPKTLAFKGTLLLVALIGVVIHKVQDPHFVITLLVFCFLRVKA